MQQQFEEAHARASETERKLCRVFGDYIHHVMENMWQMMQSNDTKTMNLDKDFEDILNKAKQTGWNGSTQSTRLWAEEEHDP